MCHFSNRPRELRKNDKLIKMILWVNFYPYPAYKYTALKNEQPLEVHFSK